MTRCFTRSGSVSVGRWSSSSWWGPWGLFFYVAPSTRQRWFSVLPGALFSVAAIIGASVGLSWFLSQSVLQVRWLTYGVIGTAIVLLFWAFLIGLMMLVGGEINAAVHRAGGGAREGRG